MARLKVNGHSSDVDTGPDTPLLWAIRVAACEHPKARRRLRPVFARKPASPLPREVRRAAQAKLAMALCAVALSFGCVALASAADAPPGASSCSGCHPDRANVDTPVPRLIGQNPAAIVAAMQAFRSGARPATVMDRIAKGFNDDEIKAIATWYAAQR
jgi:cytochrome subunit of sulfide dehydrogenase